MSGVTQVALVGAAAPEEPQYRAPARRISAAGTADRTALAFEGALSEFKAMLVSMREEITVLRAQSAAKDARYEALLESTNAALHAQAATISAQGATITGLTEAVSALTGRLDTLQKDVGPVIAKHYAPPPPPSRQIQCQSFGPFGISTDFITQHYINGEWK